MHIPIYNIDNQQEPTSQELYSVLCNNLYGKKIWKRMDTCICITESLCCTPETITTFLVNYIKKKKWTKVNLFAHI